MALEMTIILVNLAMGFTAGVGSVLCAGYLISKLDNNTKQVQKSLDTTEKIHRGEFPF